MAELKGDSMIIDGIAASEAIDSSGEILDVKGCDISDLNNGTAVLNWEHSSTKSADDQNPLQIIGKIFYGKKIFKESDCEDDRQRFYWKQVELPFIYMKARLYDGSGHPGAMAAAAMIRDHVKNNEKILLRYSIEGSTLERKDNRLLRSVARRVAATIKPCNRSCDSGVLYDPQGADGAIKNTEALAEKLLGVKKEKEESTKKNEFEHPGFMKLGASPELELDASYLTKTMTAGMPSGAPSTLTQGDALQRAPKGFRHEHSPEETKELVKKAIKAKMLKSLLAKAEGGDDEEEDEEDAAPLSEDEKRKVSNSKVRIIYNDANGRPLGKPMIVDEESFQRFMPHQRTVQSAAKGRPAFSPKAGVFFDPETGVLHTDVASMPLYIPNDEAYEQILNDPRITKAHDEAMKNWSRLHGLLKEGKLNPEVLMYASLFSGLSPNNPVPMQEIAFSHLVDMIGEGLVDPVKLKEKFDWSKMSKKGGIKELEAEIKASPEYQEFQKRVSGYSSKKKPPEDAQGLPQHARSYWAGPSGEPTRYAEEPTKKNKAKTSGVYQKGLFAPLGKFKSVVGFGLYKSILEQLVKKHGTNGRSIARALHAIKSAGDAKRARQQLADIPELQGIEGDLSDPTSVSIMGLAPKTIRYALGMMGFGDMPVPDTHWTRHAFDLDRDKLVRERILAGLNNMMSDPSASEKDKKVASTFLDKMSKDKKKANDFAKMFLPHHHVREVMWSPQNHDEMMKLDDYYEKLHPAIRKTAERLFGDPKATKDAVFPGFWLHWLTINAHESVRRGAKGTKVFNEGTHHVPFFMVMDKLHKDLGIEPLTSDHDKPYDPEAHKQQLDTEHEAAFGTKERIAAPPKETKPKKAAAPKVKQPKEPKKLGKSEEEIAPHHMDEMKKLLTANLAMEHELGEGYGQFYFYHQVLPRLLQMGDMHKSEESSEESSERSSSEGSTAEETETSWSKKPNKDGMPKVSEEFLDTFEDVTDDIDKIKIGKMNKTDLWMHEMFLMSTLKKADEPKSDSPHTLQEHHLHKDTHPEHKESLIGMELVPHTVTSAVQEDPNDEGAMGHVSFWAKDKNGHPTYVKGEDSSIPDMRNNAEAATVALARELGLEQYFPHTSVAEHPTKGRVALVKGVLGFMKSAMLSEKMRKKLFKKQNQVDMQKLALFDAMTGNRDRHDSNFGFTKDGKIWMIDHGANFHPDNIDANVSPAVAARLGINLTTVPIFPPDYIPYIEQKKLPEAVEWMQKVDPKKVVEIANRYGLIEHPKHEQAIVETVQRLKDAMLDSNKPMDSLFRKPSLSRKP